MCRRDAQRLDGPLLSFRHFYENQTDRPSVAVAQKRYDEYKSDYDKHNSRSFFKGHKDVSDSDHVHLLIVPGGVVLREVSSH